MGGAGRTYHWLRAAALGAYLLVGGVRAEAIAASARVLGIEGTWRQSGRLVELDTATGTRTVLSDLSDPAQGPLGLSPNGVAITPAGVVLVIDMDAGSGFRGALFRIDPQGGARVVISDFGDPAQGPLGINPCDVAVAPTGEIVVIDEDAGVTTLGALFAVDLLDGSRTLVSDFGDPVQGPTLSDPPGVGVAPGGTVLVAAEDRLVRVSAAGARHVLGAFRAAWHVGRTASGVVLVVDLEHGRSYSDEHGTNVQGALFSVDEADGSTSLISDFTDPGQGPISEGVVAAAEMPDGRIAVLGSAVATSGPVLFAINPIDGSRSIAIDLGPSTCGGTCASLVSIAAFPAVPSPCAGALPSEGCAVNGVVGACLGSSGPDFIIGTHGADVILGLGGDDVLHGRRRNDALCGGEGNDRLWGDRGADALDGGSGNDELRGSTGDDTLDGGDDVDRLDGGRGTDACTGETRIRCEG